MRRFWAVRSILALCGLLITASATAAGPVAPNGIIVYQFDFGLKDGAVSAMHGVALSIDPTQRLEDLTHETPPFPTGRPARCSFR